VVLFILIAYADFDTDLEKYNCICFLKGIFVHTHIGFNNHFSKLQFYQQDKHFSTVTLKYLIIIAFLGTVATTEVLCLVSGDLGCEIHCLTNKGHFLGHCDEKKDCKCEARPQEPSAGSDLAWKYGGHNTCDAFCKFTSMQKKTESCDEDDNCVCVAKE